MGDSISRGETTQADALVAAATRLVEERGVGGLTLRALGARAGVSRQAPYHHFPGGKRELVAAVAERAFRRLEAELASAARAAPAGHPDAVLALAEAYVLFALDHPELYRLMFAPELADKTPYPGLARAVGDIFGELRTALAGAGIASGPHGRELTDMASAVAAFLHGLALLAIDGWLLHGGSRERAAEWARGLLRTLLG